MDHRARYLGLDQADNVAERQLQLNVRMGETLAEALPALVGNLSLTKEQATVAEARKATVRQLAAG